MNGIDLGKVNKNGRVYVSDRICVNCGNWKECWKVVARWAPELSGCDDWHPDGTILVIDEEMEL